MQHNINNFNFNKKLIHELIRPCAINCSFMVIYERKYERDIRPLFDYFSLAAHLWRFSSP